MRASHGWGLLAPWRGVEFQNLGSAQKHHGRGGGFHIFGTEEDIDPVRVDQSWKGIGNHKEESMGDIINSYGTVLQLSKRYQVQMKINGVCGGFFSEDFFWVCKILFYFIIYVCLSVW